jgi:hypothetical protein
LQAFLMAFWQKWRFSEKGSFWQEPIFGAQMVSGIRIFTIFTLFSAFCRKWKAWKKGYFLCGVTR